MRFTLRHAITQQGGMVAMEILYPLDKIKTIMQGALCIEFSSWIWANSESHTCIYVADDALCVW